MAKKVSKIQEAIKEQIPLPEPLLANESYASATETRRNAAGDIERTDRFTNIANGIIPFRNSQGGYSGTGTSNMDVRDAVILCQKAYYNIPIFRNTIDLMVDFTVSKIRFKNGTRQGQDFFARLAERLNFWDFSRQFFREFFRSGTVIVYRIEGDVTRDDVKKINQVYGGLNLNESSGKIPVRYILLNPADIQLQGNISFSNPIYLKVLSDYELHRLRNPVTEDDKRVLDNLPPESQKLIKQSNNGTVIMPLPTDKIVSVFYNKQDYEPMAVPMGYPVLDLINWKYEMIKQDMAIARTVQQAILLITMGTDPDKGGINHKNLAAMQALFKNESVGRVLIADYTTKAQFVIPDIAELLNSKKYEVVERDIQLGLNSILTGDDKFANASIKVKIFVERLKQAQEAFLTGFLIPEIKRIARNLGFKNYPTPFFEQIDLDDEAEWNRTVTRLYELGLLTPNEAINGMDTGILPTVEDSLLDQKEFAAQKKDGLYQPIVGGPADQLNLAKESGKIAAQNKAVSTPAGRPTGSKRKQSTKNVKPMTAATYSFSKLKSNLILASQAESKIKEELLKKHKLKKLNAAQKEIANGILELITTHESPEKWVEVVSKYVENPVGENESRASLIDEVAIEHQLDPYLASLLFASKNECQESE